MEFNKTTRKQRSIELIFFILVFCIFQVSYSQELNLAPGSTIVLRTGAFQSDSDSLDKPMVQSLHTLGEYLVQRPDMKIVVQGHSDSTGRPEYNDDLSLRRAKKVREFLITNYSIRGENILVKGMGSTVPIADNTEAEGRAKNRRVEIKPLTAVTNRELTDNNNNPTNEEGILSFFNGTVQTKAPWQIGFGDAFISEPIYELHKINTRTESRAEVTFTDDSRLQVGENSLVIVYGLESKEPAIKEKGNIELVKGGLLAKLKAIDKKQEYVVKTPSAQMAYSSITKSKLAVDKSNRSTVAMYEGMTEVTAAGQSIEVPENYGTQIFEKSAPESPRKLPDPPIIFTPEKDYLPWNKDGVTFTWKPKSPMAKLEVSTDTSFNHIVWSVTTRQTLSKVNLDDGVYYWHMQGVDSIGLEGKPFATRTLTVKKYNYERARLDLLSIEEGLNTVNEPDIVLMGNADTRSIVKINGERLFLQPTGDFSRNAHLMEGDNTFVIEARDSAGFENSKTVVYRYSTSRRFGFTLGFSPLVLPNKYGSLKVGADVALKFPQLFSTDQNFGINLTVGEFQINNLSEDSLRVTPETHLRFYGFAEMMLTVEGSREQRIIPFLEVTSGAFLWANYHGEYYHSVAGAAYVAGLGAGIRSNGATNAFGIIGNYRWVINDYQRFDPLAQKGIHGIFNLQLAYYVY